jgi:peptide/nickel transport system substrate-binding protein
MAAVYDTIMRYDPDKKIYTPQTAESVTPNAESTEWTVKIRPNIKFTDGTDYDAAAVAFGLNRHRSGQAGGPTAANCAEYIACPRSIQSSGVYMALVKDIQVVDKLTLKVILTEPWTSFQYALATEPGLIPSPTALKKCDGTKNPNQCDFNLKPVGAGPFIVESFKAKDSINYVRNPNYWNGAPYLDGLRVITFGDVGGTKTYDAFKTGGADVAYLRVPDAVAQAKADKVAGISTVEQMAEFMLINGGVSVTCAGGKPEPLCVGKPDGPTLTNPSTKNLSLRKALAAAYDADLYNQRVYNGKGLASTEMFQKSFPWYPGVPGYKYDLNEAKRLVAQAKSEGWDGTVKVLWTSAPANQAGAIAIETMFKAAGINVISDVSKDAVGQQTIVTQTKDYEVTTWGTATGPDDSAMWAMAQNLLSTSPSNRAGFKSDKADAAIKALRVAKSDADKTADYKIIAEEAMAQVPWITRIAAETFRAYQPRVHGLVGGVKSYTFFDKAWIQK